MPEPVGPADEVSAATLDPFAAPNLELVEPPSNWYPRPWRICPDDAGRGPAQPGKVRLALDPGEGKDALVLLERDGFFSWQLPTGHDRAPTTAVGRGGSARRPYPGP